MTYLLENIKKNYGVITIALIYVVVNMIFTYKEIYYLNIIPIVLLIFLIAIVRLDLLYFIIVFCTPLSIPLTEYMRNSPVDFAIPTEPLLFGILLIIIYKSIIEGYLDRKVLNHPVTYSILFYLFWLVLTTITSSMPLVSIKFILARIWFFASFYFLAIYIFKKTSNISVFILCYTVPMIIVVLYATYRHLEFGLFDKQAAHFVMGPFFRDHTSYGAALAMLFFAVGGLLIKSNTNIVLRIIYLGAFFVVILGTILSYTRAAWISILFSFGVMAIAVLKIKFKYVAFLGILVILYVFSQREAIIYKMEKNKQDSSADISEHVQSISNIRSDDSNRERLNRWSAAFRMFKERPVFGWGPGTYIFNYAPFQLSKNKTNISTNFGDLGNAHSEYIGPLAETGFIGSISFIIIAIVSLCTAFKVYYNITDKTLKHIVLALLLGLITYLIHGSLNNFLDTDKISSLFWGFIAVFVSLDLFYLPKQNKLIKEGEVAPAMDKD